MPELLGYVLIFGAILYLAYIAARLVGKKNVGFHTVQEYAGG